MKRITRAQAIEELTEESFQYHLNNPEVALRDYIQFGTIGFEDLSNEDLVAEYNEVFDKDVMVIKT